MITASNIRIEYRHAILSSVIRTTTVLHMLEEYATLTGYDQYRIIKQNLVSELTVEICRVIRTEECVLHMAAYLDVLFTPALKYSTRMV